MGVRLLTDEEAAEEEKQRKKKKKKVGPGSLADDIFSGADAGGTQDERKLSPSAKKGAKKGVVYSPLGTGR